MKTKLMMAALMAATMAASSPALAFNPLAWFIQESVEDVAKEAVVDAVKQKLLGENAGSNKAGGKNGKFKRPRVELVVSRVAGEDFKALPLMRRYRFAMPKDTAIDALAVGENGGYIDRFGNEWVPIRVKSTGVVVRWLEHLSERGRFRLPARATDDGYMLVTREGERFEEGKTASSKT
jgi:hypothetical protein